jgi:hypothetical protein
MSKNSVLSKNSISYPIIIDGYISHWSQWDIFREIYSNALDSGTQVLSSVKNNTLTIIDSGTGIKPVHLLLGKNEKNSNDAIGQFGEGLKMSLIVGLRLKLDIRIESHNFLYTPVIDTLLGESVLKVNYTEYQDSLFNGTKVIIGNWTFDDYSDRFLKGDCDTLYTCKNGSILENNGKLFNKNVYITDKNIFTFSYNITDSSVKMNRDRNSNDISDVINAIGNIWAKVDNASLWSKFWQGVKNGSGESLINMSNYYMDSVSYRIAESTFKNFFGQKCALVDNDSEYSEIKHKGYTPKYVNEFGKILSLVSTFVPYANDIIRKDNEQKINIVVTHDKKQQETLAILRKIIRRYNKFDVKHLKIADLSNHNTVGLYFQGYIYIDISLLNNPIDAVSTLIHELGHSVNGARDLTDSHVTDITNLTASIILSYSKHEF